MGLERDEIEAGLCQARRNKPQDEEPSLNVLCPLKGCRHAAREASQHPVRRLDAQASTMLAQAPAILLLA